MAFQIQILQGLENIRTEVLTAFFCAISMMAENIFLTIVIAILYWCIDKNKGKRIAFFVLFNGVINAGIKQIVRMPRPFEMDVVSPIRLETATGSSFPSAHTQAATSFWFGSMIVLKTRASIILGSILIAMTALSRMYLGVHWPMDVAGAILFGIIFTYFADQIMGEKCQFKQWHIIASSLIVLGVLVFDLEVALFKTSGALWALCIGCYVEQEYIKFEVKGQIKQQVLKIAIGMIGLFAIYIGIGNLLPHVKLIEMIKVTVSVLWVTAGAPWLFKNINWQHI